MAYTLAVYASGATSSSKTRYTSARYGFDAEGFTPPRIE